MRNIAGTLVVALTLSLALPAIAQDEAAAPPMSPEQQAMMEAFEKASKPGPQHEQLEYFAGQWNASTQVWMDPAGEPMVSAGRSKNEMIYGGRFVHMHYEGEFMGEPFKGRSDFGFDNVRGRYVSTWMDDMSTGVWVAYGDYEAGCNCYTFKAEHPDPMRDGALTPVRQVIRIHGEDHYVFEHYETHEGTESKTMQIDYRRVP